MPLAYPVARYRNLSLDAAIREMLFCNRAFYSMPRLLRRLCNNVWRHRAPLISFVGNFSYRSNIRVDCRAYENFKNQRGDRFPEQVAGKGSRVPGSGEKANERL